jgi:hypothetical protein
MMGVHVRDIGHPKSLVLPSPFPCTHEYSCDDGLLGMDSRPPILYSWLDPEDLECMKLFSSFLCKAQAVVLCSEVAPTALKYALKYVRPHRSKWLGPKHGSLKVVKHQNYV